MARTIYQYKPFIDPSSTAVGIKLPFNQAAVSKNDRSTRVGNVLSGSFQTTSGKGVFSLSYTTEDQAISNLTNLLLTRKGERYMQPNFGTDIYGSIFEQNTEILADNLQSSLQDDINFWLPYITLINVDVFRDVRNENALNIRIVFRVTNVGANLVINVLAQENTIIVSQATPQVDVNRQLTAVGVFASRRV
jgi:phage baseplate assembly protein W